MNPTIFMAWLSDTSANSAGGWWTDGDRIDGDSSRWSQRAPLHLSFHTTADGALAALRAACRLEWERTQCSYAHGPWVDKGEEDTPAHDDKMVAYMARHVGYEIHVTEQTVQFTPEESGEELPPAGQLAIP